MAGKNPNISLSFHAAAAQAELKQLTDNLKTVKKEFEVSNLAIQANGNAMDLAANKIAGYVKQAQLQSTITAKIKETLEQANKAHADAGTRVDAARAAYDRAAKSESTSAAELKKLKKELDNAQNTYDRLGKAVGTWNSKLLDSQKAENQLKVSVKQTNDAIEQQNKHLAQNAYNSRNVVSSTGQLVSLYNILRGLIIGYTGKKLYEVLIGDNAQFEQYVTSFEVLLDGAEKAKAEMDRLTQFAAVTPFTLPQVVTAETRLLAYGVAAKDAAKTMQMLGDISMGQADKLDRISLAYGQVVTNQRLYGTELRQFAENGVPLLEALADMYGVTAAEMRDMVSDGQIGADAVTAALERMTSAGGQFFGMMDKQSKTMNGMLSTMQDNFQMFARDVGDKSFNYLKGELGELMDEISRLEQSGELGDISAEWGRNIANFVSKSADAIKTLWDLKEVLVAAGAGVIAFKTTMAISGTVQTVTLAITTYTTAVKGGATATAALNAVMNVNPWVLLASAIAAVITVLVTYNALADDTVSETDKLIQKTKDLTEEYEVNQKAAERSSNVQLGNIEIARRLTGELDELDKKVNKTTEDKGKMASIVDQLNEKIPNLALAINSETGELNKQIGVVYDAITAYKQLLLVKAGESKAQAAAGNLLDLEDQNATLQKELQGLLRQKIELNKITNSNSLITSVEEYEKQLSADLNSPNVDKKINEIRQSIEANNKAIADANKQIDASFKLSEEYAQKYGSTGSGEIEPYTPPPLLEGGTGSSSKTTPKEITDLKYSYDMGYITASEYYEKLAGLRDKYYKTGTEDWQKYTLEIKNGQERLSKDAAKLSEEGYKKRLQNSEEWITDEKKYRNMSSADEIAAYERIRTYTEEYYKAGIIDYETYRKQMREIDSDMFDVRKTTIQEAIKAETEAAKEGLDAKKKILEQEKKDIEDSYDKRKQAIEDYYDEIDRAEKQADRVQDLKELRAEEAKYANAATTEGKARLKKIQEEIEKINDDIAKDAREAEKKMKLSKAEKERDEAEAERLKKVEQLNRDYENLDTAQKKLLDSISNYAVTSAGAIEEVTKRIQAMVQAFSGTGISTSVSTAKSSFTLNDYGSKNFNNLGQVVNYKSELAGAIINAARILGVSFR